METTPYPWPRTLFKLDEESVFFFNNYINKGELAQWAYSMMQYTQKVFFFIYKNEAKFSFFSVAQRFNCCATFAISAWLPRFFVMAGRRFILVGFWFCLPRQRQWCASSPPPTGQMWPTFLAGIETQCVRQPIGSGLSEAQRCIAADYGLPQIA